MGVLQLSNRTRYACKEFGRTYNVFERSCSEPAVLVNAVTPIEYHVPSYQYFTKLRKRLARGDPGKNRLDRIAKQHDIDYSVARNLRDKMES